MIRKILYFGAVLSLVVLPFFAQAADLKTGTDDAITLGERETYTNLYLVNNNITVNSKVKGDLTTAGNSLLLNGEVGNSLFAAGSTIISRSSIGHTARMAGGTITFSEGHIGDDLLVAGNEITIGKGVVIGGDLLVAASRVTIDGTVKGIVRAAAGDVVVNGDVQEVIVYGSTLKFGATAHVAKDVKYTGQNQAEVTNGAVLDGLIHFTQTQKADYGMLPLGISLWSMVMVLLGAIVLATLFVRFLPKLVSETGAKIVTSPMISLGYGLILLVVVPILSLFLIVSVVGQPLAWLILALLALIGLTGSLISKITFGSVVLKFLRQQSDNRPTYQGAILGVVLISLLKFIPVVGSIFIFLLVITGWGALLDQIFQGLKRQRL